MGLRLDSSIEQIFTASGVEIVKVIRKSDGLVLWEAYPLGSVEEFNYTGDVQIFTAPVTGVYKLQVWGAEGADTETHNAYGYGGKGGYSEGSISLIKGQVLYVCIGGKPQMNTFREYHHYDGGHDGGYNGGAKGNFRTWDSDESPAGGWQSVGGSSGGGATHIAMTTNRGVLANYIDNKSEVLIVAGGGGGSTCGYNNGYWDAVNGGTGGGESGGYPIKNYNSETISDTAPGTQTTGYAFGQGGTAYGGASYGGGGGGWYGGTTKQCGAGSGGSGYVGGVENGETLNGQREGDGYAVITYQGRVSSGIVTYVVDGVEYEVEVAIGLDCLNPTSFVIPEKDGYVFVGWSYTDGGEVLVNCYMGQSNITLYAIYVEATPYYVTLTDYSLTDISGAGEDWIVTITGDGYYYLGALNSTGSIKYARASGSVTLPTNNCNKVRIKYNASYYESRTDLVTINDVGCITNGTDEYLYLDCSGDNFKLTFSVSDPSDYYWVKLTIKEIYFYYE
jgi:uncharacterized repeat protein (TIGR02543 family)